MLKNIKIIILFLIVIFVIAKVSYWHSINSSLNKNGEDISFAIESGQSVERIGKNLEEQGLIKSVYYFKRYVRKIEAENSLQAGVYTLNPRMSIKDIVNSLVKGEVNDNEMVITVIEGWNVQDIDEYLVKQGIASDSEFSDIALSKGRRYEFYNDAPITATLEGYLFPDTYRIFKDAIAEDIVFKMLSNFDKKLTKEIRDEIVRQGKSIYEIVTMASIIEKEVRTEEDMKVVSGIFWDRIKYGQPLESCATLAYIIGEDKAVYTFEDTKINSPYNTYEHQGLPPGPICNPGLKAIKAAVYPKYTDYNYFLSDPETGKTIFSVTYEEHLKNKAKYLR